MTQTTDESSDDRDRPLELATRSVWLLGLVSSLFGLVFVVVFGYFNRYRVYRLHFIALGLIVWFIPGVLFLTFAHMLKQRLRRGAIGGIFVAIAQGICAAGGVVAFVWLPPFSVIPLVLSALWVLALAQTVYHLKQSLPLLAADPGSRHGFQIALPQRVISIEEVDERQDAKTPGEEGD